MGAYGAGQYGFWTRDDGEEGVDWEWTTNNKGSRVKKALHNKSKPKTTPDKTSNSRKNTTSFDEVSDSVKSDPKYQAINREYNKLFGRDIGQEGFDYWGEESRYQSLLNDDGKIGGPGSKFEKALLAGAGKGDKDYYEKWGRLGYTQDEQEHPSGGFYDSYQGIDTIGSDKLDKDSAGTQQRIGRGSDPNTLDIGDMNTFMLKKYYAPGREGDYNPTDPIHNPRHEDYEAPGAHAGTAAGKALMQSIETKFIDELYGTTGGVVTDDTFNEAGEAVGGAIGAGTVTTEWGLDIVRIIPPDLDPSSESYYEHVTRGEVDWAFYRDDNAFQAAFTSMEGKTVGDLTWDANGLDGQPGITSIDEIRALNPSAYQSIVEESQGMDWHTQEWESKYQSSYDPYKPEWQPVELEVTGEGDPGGPKFDTFTELPESSVPISGADFRNIMGISGSTRRSADYKESLRVPKHMGRSSAKATATPDWTPPTKDSGGEA